MTRAAFVMDRYMRPLGLQGRSFIPLVSGCACAVPAIMATRTIQQQEERLATIMVVPLISCSARLPDVPARVRRGVSRLSRRPRPRREGQPVTAVAQRSLAISA
jgi:hypothetical protein